MGEQQNEDLETEAGKLGQALEKMDAEGLRLEEELAEVIKSCSPQLSPVEFPVSLSLDTPSECVDCIAERRSLLHDAMNAKVEADKALVEANTEQEQRAATELVQQAEQAMWRSATCSCAEV